MAENENGYSLCEECGVNEACYTVSVMMDGQITQRHLCPDCMAKMNMNLAAGNVRRLISEIMSAVSGILEDKESESAPAAPEADAAAGEGPVCECCGTSVSQFTKSGKLGCPTCYMAFREQLTPMLQQIHGRVQHAGRKPIEDESAQMRRTQYERLSRHLEAAVAVEDFETAAVIRDQLRKLAAEGGEG